MVIIKRKESKFIDESRKWVILYGRRKTGKTFLVKNFIKFDEYFFVKRDRTIIDKKTLSYETFMELLKEYVKNNKTVVVDEFHRLGDDFLDFLHSLGRGGKIILLSSTLHLSKKILSSKSPLLGLVSEVSLDLIPLSSCIGEIRKLGFSKKDALELSIFCREPIVIESIEKGKEAKEIIAEVMLATKHTVPALIGEIFVEEDRQISRVYEGILRAVAIGKNKAGEIANYLFSKQLIKKESSTIIQQYLKNLIEFGILKRVLIFNKNDYRYELVSPLMKLYFYADEKYNFSEEASQEKARLILSELIPRLVESNVREALAEKYGFRESVIETKDFDIDGCLLRFKKPAIALEVKWGDLGKIDLDKIKETLGKADAPRKILFVQDKKNLDSVPDLEIIDISDL
ncbi:hypothetical protein A3K73_00905 [Candidatus Pacearchaeota archaeon RBG_13_36_9]|nr:MAG: hypothetical protein A3K73_00905 [Candidatus Pacearchaeota archaeon RBG_13_36_9]